MSTRTMLAVGAGLLVTAFGLSAAYTYGTGDEVTFTVTDKERIVETSSDSDGNTSVSSKYLIFTDGETFENTDSLLKLKFNSSDVYGGLREGSTYNCDVYGWRIPLLSSYRNIVSCEEAAPAPAN